MTDTEVNVAIAEACGWKFHDWTTHQMPYWTNPQGVVVGLPDYCSDLNAMQSAEKTLSREQLDLYCDALLSLMHEVDPGYFSRINWGHAVELLTATARERAEAFLRTLGKWRE